ncbi:unnamed protein product [Mytilus coruscus]|uniref:Uncharacterized protein n=1 Tax=Mytilus coruscus TaxID=42192 RepID=A0A6J8E2G1_MYTCO|nr:unnamed protein product [Mytilus coruscus]
MDSLNSVLNLVQRRLGNFSRPERCIFPYTNSQSTQKVSKILCQQSVLPISGAVLRSNISTSNIHQSVFSGGSSITSPKYSSSSLSRRLVFDKSGQTIADFRSRENAQSPNKIRVCSKSRKVKPHSNTINNIHRAVFSLNEGIVPPTSERVSKLLSAVELILNKQSQATTRDFLQLLVIIASCIELIPNARLFMRLIQLHLLYHWKPVCQNLGIKIPFSKHLKGHLRWWLNIENLVMGRSITPWGNVNNSNNRRIKIRVQRSHQQQS